MFLSDHPKAQIVELTENQLEKISSCGVCGCQNLKRIGFYRGNPEIHFVQCEKCGAVTYDKILAQSFIDEIYDGNQYYDDTEEDSLVTFYGVERFGKHLLNAFKTVEIKEKCRILDFGGGDGAIAYNLASKLKEKYPDTSFEIIVVDYTEKLFRSNNDGISMFHAFPLETLSEENKFDIVVASAVVEHIPRPKDIFLKLFSVVKKGGLLYFRTPYRYPLHKFAKHFKVDFDMLYPGHIWDFGGDKWWRHLTQVIGLKSKVQVISSKPAIVEKSFKSHFFVALLSYLLKAPWYICHLWCFVGGWEVVYKKIEE